LVGQFAPDAGLPNIQRGEFGKTTQAASTKAELGDDAAAASMLEAFAQKASDPTNPLRARDAGEAAKAAKVYRDRARWTQENTPAARRALLRSLLLTDNPFVYSVHDLSAQRVRKLLEAERAGDPAAQAIAPRPVQVVPKPQDGVPAEVTHAFIGALTESLRAIGFKAESEEAPDVLAVEIRLGSTLDLSKENLGPLGAAFQGAQSCAIEATGDWHAGGKNPFPSLAFGKRQVGWTGEAACRERAAKEAGAGAGTEVIRSWLRQNP
jgi:hypothetical protein